MKSAWCLCRRRSPSTDRSLAAPGGAVRRRRPRQTGSGRPSDQRTRTSQSLDRHRPSKPACKMASGVQADGLDESQAPIGSPGPTKFQRSRARFVERTLIVHGLMRRLRERVPSTRLLTVAQRIWAADVKSSQPGGFSPASDLGRRSVLRRTVGSQWRHSRRHTAPHCRPEAARTADQAAAD